MVLLALSSICAQTGQGQELGARGKTLDQWKEQLQDHAPIARCAAAEALGKMGAEAATATPMLTQLHTDNVLQVRILSAMALGNIGPSARTAVPVLTKLLEDNNRDVRSCAAESLGQIGAGDQQTILNLIRLLNDEDRFVQSAAAGALGRMGIAEVPTLTEVVADKSSGVRLAAGKSLAELGPKDRAAAVSILSGLLRDNKATVWGRFTALHILGRMGSDAKAAIPTLTELLSDKKSICVVTDTLRQIGPDGITAALPILTELIRDPDERISSDAAKAMKNIMAENRKGDRHQIQGN